FASGGLNVYDDFVTTMVLVTTSVQSGRASRFPLVRRIACAVCRQPKPVGLSSAWRMLNKLRKICTRHRLEDRLQGTTRTNPSGVPHADPHHQPLFCRLPERRDV